MSIAADGKSSSSQSEYRNEGAQENSSFAYLVAEWIFNYTLKALEKLSPLFILYGTAALIGFGKKLLN